GLFDVSYLRGIPNIVHMDPTNEDELADMLYTAMLHDGPSAVRYPRGTGPGVEVKPHPVALPIGKAKVVREGEDFAVLGLGALLPMAEELADRLEERGAGGAERDASGCSGGADWLAGPFCGTRQGGSVAGRKRSECGGGFG